MNWNRAVASFIDRVEVIMMVIRILLGAILGAAPGVLHYFWFPPVGMAVGTAGLVIGILVAEYGISAKRFFALALVAMFGKAIAPIAEAADI